MVKLSKSESNCGDTQCEAPVEEQRPSEVSFVPRFDIVETDDELTLYGDLPGVDPQDLEIRFDKGALTVHGKAAPRWDEKNQIRAEYGVGDFYRTFSIDEAIDADKIVAELKNGELTLHLPKSEAVKPRRIAISVG